MDTLLRMLGKKRKDEIVYQDLASMMAAYAEQAVYLAEKEYLRRLDYSEESIEALEEIASQVAQKVTSGEEEQQQVRLWGAYFGELLRKRYAGEWTITDYPGGATAVPALELRGSRLFPLMKVYRRLSMGKEENLVTFYRMVASRLGDPAKVN